MPEYIEREKVLSKAVPMEGCFSGMISAYDVIMLPAADVAPVRHGRWIEHKHFNHDHYIDSTYECSECNVEEPLTSDYCPNCGAKMDGGAE